MKRQKFLKLLSTILCVVLIAAIALMTIGCKDNSGTKTVSSDSADITFVPQVTSVGEGKTQFDFIVVDKDGKEKHFKVSTDKTIVGEALLEVGLIEGEESQYGLFVKKVDGIKLDFDTDGMYWGFYVNDEYALKGVDSTEITKGETYSFKASK